MKKSMNLMRSITLIGVLFMSTWAMAQVGLQNYRQPSQDGLNVYDFGMNQGNTDEFDGLKVHVGGDFAIQYQMLTHEYGGDDPTIAGFINIGPSVNLPTANLNIDAQLAKGVRVHLRTYLSSLHHNETWVKGGYLTINSLDFIKEGFAEELMDVFAVRAGQDNFNYGDAVSRRTDNAMAIYNPFVGNYLMDNNTVEPFLEVYAFPGDFIAMIGASTGILNPTVIVKEGEKYPPTFHGKLGWDSELTDDVRVRLTGSFYTSSGYNTGGRLYGGDRAGARYYKVFGYVDTSGASSASDFAGRFNPGFKDVTSFQINPFVKFMGLEFFGIYEVTSGFKSAPKDGQDVTKGMYSQIGAEVLYRFGAQEQLYVGGRYNSVSGYGQYMGNKPENEVVNRLNIGFGWFMTKNILTKVEYVSQTYNDQFSGALKDAKMNGAVIEAVISF